MALRELVWSGAISLHTGEVTVASGASRYLNVTSAASLATDLSGRAPWLANG